MADLTSIPRYEFSTWFGMAGNRVATVWEQQVDWKNSEFVANILSVLVDDIEVNWNKSVTDFCCFARSVIADLGAAERQVHTISSIESIAFTRFLGL